MMPRISWPRKISSGLLLVYAALVIGWAVAHQFVGDGYWLLALFNGFAVYLFAPLPLAALLALLARNRTAWLAWLSVALLFGALFGGDLLPPSPVARAGSTDPALTVMTYNVLYTNTTAGPIATTVIATAPDVVAFQELTSSLAQQLEREIGTLYPYRTPMHPATCFAETAIWSRYPLRAEQVDEEILCRVSMAVVEIEGRAVRVVDVHAWPYTGLDRAAVERGFRWRQEQIEWVLGRVAGQPEPLLLLGDLNSAPMHTVYRTVAACMVDSFREAGWGLGHTFPATEGRAWNLPRPGRLVRIDHIFHSAAWRAEAAWVGEWDGQSDHLPVVARLRLLQAD